MDATNRALLVAIAASAEGTYALPKDLTVLLDLKLVEVNTEIKNPNNKKEIAVRVTALGTEELAKPDAPAEAPIPTFVIANVKRPKADRSVSGKEPKYPFAKLGHFEDGEGQSFFIAATAAMKSPSKSYGSIVSAANKKFSTEADYRHFTTRTILDGKDYGQPGVKGAAIFRATVAEETALKAKAFPPKPVA